MDIRRLSNVMNGKTNDDDAIPVNSTPLLQEDGIDGIDVSNSAFRPPDDYPESEEGNMYDDEDYSDELEDEPLDSPSIYGQPSTTVNQYQSIESAQQGFDIIAGINDIPTKYRDENLIPELVAPSIQYNRFKGAVAQAEWQIKARSLIRKHQMYRGDYPLDDRDIAGYTYLNDLLLTRADDGFERKMSNNNLNGVYQENATESAPVSSSKRRGGFFGSMFGGGGGGE